MPEETTGSGRACAEEWIRGPHGQVTSEQGLEQRLGAGRGKWG